MERNAALLMAANVGATSAYEFNWSLLELCSLEVWIIGFECEISWRTLCLNLKFDCSEIDLKSFAK